MKFLATVLSFVLFFGCRPKDQQTIVPDYILEMSDVTILSEEDYKNTGSIKLIRDQVFGDTDDVYIGRIREFITDESNRLYVIDSAHGARAIHVYAPDGSYITNVGRMGEGPGEYLNPCCLKVRSNRLFVYDHGLARLTVYTLDTFEVVKTVTMDPGQLAGSSQLDEKVFTNYYYLDDETLLLAYIKPQKYFETKSGSIHYFTADKSFQQLKKEILVQDQILEVWGKWREHRVMKYFPFYSKPLITVTPAGRIFYADSKDFLIRELNKEGDKIGGFYIPLPWVSLNREEAFSDVSDMEKDIANNAILPDRWPILKSIWSDESDLLWISTFTEVEDELDWWVIEPDAKSLATFSRSGNRNAYPLFNGRTFKHIRGDYFYTLEDDTETGLQAVVRYRIEW